ncbi:MAG TPA: hypothetical protein VF796_14250 [Humisphaera sp.]
MPPRVNACAVLLVVAFVTALVAAPKPRLSVAVPPPTEPAATQATSRPSWPPVPDDALLRVYQTELGDRFDPAKSKQYLAAQDLIESYFENPKAAARSAVVKQLEATGLDAGTVGRLCRVRKYWPALDAGGVYYVNEKVGVFPTRYFFGLPRQYDRTKPWPLVIKLPTAHAFITDPPPTAEQVAQIYTKWVKEELEAHPDAVVVMPLLNLDELWGPSYGGTAAVVQPMQHVAGRANIDPSRVYLSGHAMSSYACWNLALHQPTYFAAFNALAGGASQPFQRIRVINLRNTLPVAWHDADDKVTSVKSTQGIVQALRLQKVNVEYEETKGLGHAPDAATEARLYQKMRSRTRELYPTSVALQSNRPDSAYNRVDWVQVYQPLEPGDEKKATFGWGSGVMRYNANSHRLEATRNGNRVDVTASNVETFRVYLNDQMVDLTKPVTVAVNGRVRFEGVVPQSVDEMMKDQIFLGRGWRYFTAVVDIDVTGRPTPTTTLPATRAATRPATVPGVRPATVPATRRTLPSR